MTDQLTVYNLALGHLGERKLGALNENREPRRVLDDYWATVTAYCLAQGVWSFALRASGALTQVAGDFGFTHGYTKPTDIILLFSAADNAGMNPQIDRDFIDHGVTFYTNSSSLYTRYTSNDATNGGMNLAKWTAGFTSYVAAALAAATCMRITGREKLAEMMEEKEDRFYLATFWTDSVALVQGQLPFNATARNPLGSDAIQTGHSLLPFAAHHRAMSRLQQQRPQAGG